MIVSATVTRVFESNGQLPARILCKLENGLDGTIGENDAEFFQGDQRDRAVDVGSIVTVRVHQIKFNEKNPNDESFSVILKCKQSDLRRHDAYIDENFYQGVDIPEEDLVNINFKNQEE